MAYELDRDLTLTGEPSLSEMTSVAVESLSQAKDGFVLLVEGARIDHAHHENNAKRSLHDAVEMEKAVEVGQGESARCSRGSSSIFSPGRPGLGGHERDLGDRDRRPQPLGHLQRVPEKGKLSPRYGFNGLQEDTF